MDIHLYFLVPTYSLLSCLHPLEHQVRQPQEQTYEFCWDLVKFDYSSSVELEVSLSALVKHLDGISDADIAGLNIPTGIPLYYKLNADLSPVVKGGEYLDAEAAKEAITAVANQGKK